MKNIKIAFGLITFFFLGLFGMEDKKEYMGKYVQFLEYAQKSNPRVFKRIIKGLGCTSEKHYALAQGVIKHPMSDFVPRAEIVFSIKKDGLKVITKINKHFEQNKDQKEIQLTKKEYNSLNRSVPRNMCFYHKGKEAQVMPGFWEKARYVSLRAVMGGLFGGVCGGMFSFGLQYKENHKQAQVATALLQAETYQATEEYMRNHLESNIRVEVEKEVDNMVTMRQIEYGEISMAGPDEYFETWCALDQLRGRPFGEEVSSLSCDTVATVQQTKEMMISESIFAKEESIIAASVVAGLVATSAILPLPTKLPTADELMHGVGAGSIVGGIVGMGAGVWGMNEPIETKSFEDLGSKRITY